ncbi:hypothetical protein C2E21_3142 [Chlorella sorokiniana]|uniref:PABC domain-containing protein n=1 Tax=Chlorella sorokiniana TaxID=3076 RepID=A0A2P6TVY3_CHLSO|nr:hypothetical protein C2E21_3142 [Chlorella sorokiniana]|eukprot:PRW58229.1 hypothetical protein C2E21_3142 [Chlorella sorokiniana]
MDAQQQGDGAPAQPLTAEMLAALLKAGRGLWDALRHSTLSYRWRADLRSTVLPIVQRIQPDLAGPITEKVTGGSLQTCLETVLDQDAFLAAISKALQPGLRYTAVPPVAEEEEEEEGPLTLEALNRMPPEVQKQQIGERLFPLVSAVQPDLAGKITGMMLEIDNPELVELLAEPIKVVLKVAEATHVLLMHNAVPAGAKLKGFDASVEQFSPAAKRPLVCESWVLAGMPHEERPAFMERRLFAAVAQLQPLAPWLIMAALKAALNFEHCFSLRMLADQAQAALRYLDQPLELAAKVNHISAAGTLAGFYREKLLAGQALRSEAEVLEAAALMLPEGNSMPWSPASHCRFPPACRSAAQALLLSKRRARALVAAVASAAAAAREAAAAAAGSNGAEGEGAAAAGGISPRELPHAVPAAVAALDSLPDELVQPILRMAAHPLDAWYSEHV